MSVSVCVCLSVAIISSEIHVRSSPNFMSMLLMSVARSSSDGVVIFYVLPVLWMTSYLLISQARLLDVATQLNRSGHAALGLAINCAVIPVAGQRTHRTTFWTLNVNSQVATPGAESAVNECLVTAAYKDHDSRVAASRQPTAFRFHRRGFVGVVEQANEAENLC